MFEAFQSVFCTQLCVFSCLFLSLVFYFFLFILCNCAYKDSILSSFRSTCPYRHNLFWCSTEIVSFNPSLSLILYLELYLVAERYTATWPFSSLPAEVPPYFPFLWARSHLHATYYFTRICCPHYQWYPSLLVSHRLCKPAYLMPVPSLDKLEGLC